MSEEKTHELPKPVSQDDPTGRKWTWEEDEYTVIRTHARTGRVAMTTAVSSCT